MVRCRIFHFAGREGRGIIPEESRWTDCNAERRNTHSREKTMCISDGLIEDCIADVCVSGSGLGDDLKRLLVGRLGAAAAESGFVQTDSRGIAFQMVRPEMVCEVSFGDLVAEDSRGRAKTNPLLEFDGGAWKPCGRMPGVAAQAAVIERFRDDKGIDPADIRVEQLSQICPFAERKEAAALPKSTLLKRKVFKKTSKDKVMLQKFVVWKTNKEADPPYPAFVFHYTDFSSGRKDPLKKDIRVAATEEQINAIFDAFVAENVKKGWEEVQ